MHRYLRYKWSFSHFKAMKGKIRCTMLDSHSEQLDNGQVRKIKHWLMDKLSKRKPVSFLPLLLQVWMTGYCRICWKVYLNPYLSLFTHHSPLRHPFCRAALKTLDQQSSSKIFEEHVCADKFCADTFPPLFAHTPPTSFTPPPFSKEQIPPVWATPLRLLWNRLPLWQEKKKGK